MKFFLFFFFCIFWLLLFFLFSFLRWFNYFDFLLRRLTNRWSCLGCFNRFSLLFFHYFLWLYSKILTLFLCDSKTSSSIFEFYSLNFSLLSWHIINFIDLFYKSIGVVLWTFYDFLTLFKAKTDINFFLSIIFLILIWLLLSTNFYNFWSFRKLELDLSRSLDIQRNLSLPVSILFHLRINYFLNCIQIFCSHIWVCSCDSV